MSISVRDLLEAGAHFGHQTHRWNPRMKPYIYGSRNGIHIIDLQKTAVLWGRARKAIVDTVARGGKVLFVGTKPQAQEVLEEETKRAGQYFVNRRWLGGTLTNFKTIKSRIDWLDEIEAMKASGRPDTRTKREALHLEKERTKLEKGLQGIRKMTKLPDLVVVIDPKKEHIAISEARKLGIPIAGIVDTNCDPNGIDFVIPANDDAVKSVRLLVASMAEACLEGMKQFELHIQEETRRMVQAEKTKSSADDSGTQTPESAEEIAPVKAMVPDAESSTQELKT